MLLKWLLLVCHCVYFGQVSCTQHNSPTHTDNGLGEEDLATHSNYDEVPIDFKDATPTHTSHYSKAEEEVCLNVEDSHCGIHTVSHVMEDDSGGKTATQPGQDDSVSSSGREIKKQSGCLSDWNVMYSGKDEVGDLDESPNEDHVLKKESAVKILHHKGDFERFINVGHVVIVFFYKDGNSEALQRFLIEYDVSANHLLQYRIYLALAECTVFSVGSYCTPEKVNRFAYGFREGQEKIAFPLDTLFNNNAIVASALHLDLINAVPILQTAGERRELERRCKGRCDIIFSFQRTLGTYEHRMFLEIAHAYQDSYVFAITTYTAGTLGLSYPHQQESEDVEQRVWVVHCVDKRIHQQCVVSYYRRKMLLPELLQFLAALQLPKWHDLDVSPSMDVVITPYDGTSLPWVILIYDSSCKPRVMGLAPDLAQLLHGSVATMTLDLDRVSDAVLRKLELVRGKIVTPALVFLHQEQDETALLNDYDDPLEWVNEQLSAIYENPLDKEELGYQPVQALEELLQDDEVVMGMQREETFTNISPLSGSEAYAAAINSNALTLIAFYLAWDPVSSMLLQHMNEIMPKLGQYGSQAVLHRINCFDWPKLCDSIGIAGYPELRIYPRNRQNTTYNGPIHSESITKTILLYGRPSPIDLDNLKEVDSLLALDPDLHQACKLVTAATVGIFPTKDDSVAFMEAAQILHSSHLTGRYISKEAVRDMCGNDEGCVLVSKPKDPLQPRAVLNTGIHNSRLITNFLRHSVNYVLAPLDFERLTTLSGGNGLDGSESTTDQHLILLFIPASSSLPHSHRIEKYSSGTNVKNSKDESNQKNIHNEMNQLHSEEEMWEMVGHLAAEFSEPGFIFSWIKGDDPLAEKLLLAYRLTATDFNLVAVNWKHNTISESGEGTKDKSDEKNGVHIYTCPDLSPHSLRPWIISLKEQHLTPAVMLGENDWEPRLPGFDYIKFMMEDEDRDAEDHLMAEMESDLSSHPHHGEDSEGLLHIHKDL